MKVIIEVELGNDDVQTLSDVRRIVSTSMKEQQFRSLLPEEYPLEEGVGGTLRDRNGNKVGMWLVGKD